MSRMMLCSLLRESRFSCMQSARCAHIMAIRREDSNIWERRAPLSPQQVSILTNQGIRVLVQPSNRRAYPMQEYAKAGAIVEEDISSASLVMGVKQPLSIDSLMPNKTYAFFSHTIKAQEANMALLDALLEKNIRLLDYECMVDENNKRLVAFGKYAGVAGMLNILHGLGLRLLALGHHTPFTHIGPPHNYRNSEQGRSSVRAAGYEIALGLMPKSVGPITFIFTGTGNVSQGAQEVFRELPYEFISPEHLPKVAAHGDTNKVYGCVVNIRDNIVRKSGGGPIDPQHFFANPTQYASTFSTKIAPYASVIINGIFWAPGHPRLITIPDAKRLLQPQSMPWLPSSPGCPRLPHRLLAICDISADPGGSMEFVQDCTTINHPFCLYDAEQHMERESFSGPGVLVCSIDNMPTQLPRESTDFFGSLLLPHVAQMLKCDATTPHAEDTSSPVVRNAAITANGALTPRFQYIQTMREERSARRAQSAQLKEKAKQVLVLGAGYVSAPVVEYLTRSDNTHVSLVSKLKSEIDQLSGVYPNTSAILLDLERHMPDLKEMISQHDVVVSLLPYGFHPEVAKMCIDSKTHMVTASYVSPQMQELHQSAAAADVTIINEVGLDPGIDHMLAVQCFNEAKEHGGTIESYVSYCGGLPAPEAANNALRYKFSWSPRGVFQALLNNAKFIEDSQVVEIGAGGLLDIGKPMDFLPAFALEGFPNRDSTVYAEKYNLPNAATILRGTLRYRGFCDVMKGIIRLGLISIESHPKLHPHGPDVTWKEFIAELVGQKGDVFDGTLNNVILERTGGNQACLSAIQELGLLTNDLVDRRDTPLDTIAHYLDKRLSYDKGERDIIIMHHEIGIRWPDNSSETRHIDLVVYGEPHGHSAMAKTVGYPTAIATKMLLEGEIQHRGLVMPLDTDIYPSILRRLAQEGVSARETSTGDASYVKERLHRLGLSG